MALPSSGIIKLSDLIAEFGGGDSLADFFRNGGLVPTNSTTQAIPTSGLLAMTHFYGAAKTVAPPVSITDRTISDIVQDSSGALISVEAGYLLQTDTGVYGYVQNGGGYYYTGEMWLTSGSIGDYQARATHVSGGAVYGTLDTWLSLSSGRQWSVGGSGYGNVLVEAVILVEISRVSDSVVLTSAYITMRAERVATIDA